MAKKILNLNILRIVIEILSLLFVVLLVKNDKLQLWLVIFIAGVVISLFAGRLFCGWICPMNTIFRVINFIYGKLKIKRLKTPKILNNKVFRLIFLILLFGSMITIKILGFDFNMLLYIILFSVILTLIFQEEFWHRHLCPFGTILSLTSKKAKLKLSINEDDCIACGKCQKVCPTLSIITLENKKRRNINNECLLCLQCVDACPADVCQITGK